MATESTTDPQGSDGTVSQEAFKRVQTDLQKEKDRTADLEKQLAASHKVNRVESFLRDRDIPKTEIPARMELLAPHLPEIPIDGLEDALSADKFKPIVTPPVSTTTPPPDGEPNSPPATDGSVVAPPDGGFGGQPNPGGDATPVTSGLVGPGDVEYEAARTAAQRGDHTKMQKLYDDERVAEPVRPY